MNNIEHTHAITVNILYATTNNNETITNSQYLAKDNVTLTNAKNAIRYTNTKQITQDVKQIKKAIKQLKVKYKHITIINHTIRIFNLKTKTPTTNN